MPYCVFVVFVVLSYSKVRILLLIERTTTSTFDYIAVVLSNILCLKLFSVKEVLELTVAYGSWPDPTLSLMIEPEKPEMWDAHGVHPEVEARRVVNPYVSPKGKGWLTKCMGSIMSLSLWQLQSVGFELGAFEAYQQQFVDVGGAVPTLTLAAPRWAALFIDDPKPVFW
jgi:hypothetical protein